MKQKTKSETKSRKCLAFNTSLRSMKTIFKTFDELSDECEHFFGRFPAAGHQSRGLDDYKRVLNEFRAKIQWPDSGGHPKSTRHAKVGRPVKKSSPAPDNKLPAIPDSDTDCQCYWPKCAKTFGQKNSLISHIESYHLRKERFKCCVQSCGQAFNNKSALTSHMTGQHSTEAEHRCAWIECHIGVQTCHCLWPSCGRQFFSRNAADSHMEETHLKRAEEEGEDTADQKPLRCPHNECSFEAVDRHELNDHELNAHKYVPISRRKARPKQESTEVSTNVYTGKPLMRKRRPKKFRCTWPACEAAFESQHTVAIHMRKHTGEKPFVCDWPDCGKTFRFKGGLKLHKESTHLKIKQFKCDFCGEGFLLQSALTVHKSKHTGVKKLQCDWPGCEWRTNFSQQLAIHRQRTHEGKKVYLKRYSNAGVDPTAPYDSQGRARPYRCEWPGCERRFRLECNLQPHLTWHQKTENQSASANQKDPTRAKQRSDQVFECDWIGCMARYTTRHMLKQHINTHTGARPYSCKFCSESFAMRTQLRTHTIGAHPGLQQNKPKRTERNRTAQRVQHSESSDNFSMSSGRPLLVDSSASYMPQGELIRLNQIRAFNSLQIQPQNPMGFVMAYKRDRMTPTPVQSTHTTARKLLTNAKRVRSVTPSVPVDSQSIAEECPHPCPQTGCWRRFRTDMALKWHLRKFHPGLKAP